MEGHLKVKLGLRGYMTLLEPASDEDQPLLDPDDRVLLFSTGTALRRCFLQFPAIASRATEGRWPAKDSKVNAFLIADDAEFRALLSKWQAAVPGLSLVIHMGSEDAIFLEVADLDRNFAERPSS